MTLLVGRSLALPVTSDKASSVAATFWCELTGSKAKPELKDLSSQWTYDGIYLFVRHEGGFVLVAADDASRPILGYSTTSTIDPTNLPPALSEWLGQYQVQIEAARSLNGTACRCHRMGTAGKRQNAAPRQRWRRPAAHHPMGPERALQ